MASLQQIATSSNPQFVIKDGMCLRVRPSEPNTREYIARVEGLKLEGNTIRCRWFYRPEDIIGGPKSYHAEKELLLSNEYVLCDRATVEGPCRVLTLDAYSKLKVVGDDDYFCRFEYDVKSGTSFPEPKELYCKCKTPFNPDKFMIGCDNCPAWFHPKCIKMPLMEAKDRENYVCANCTRKCQSSATKALPNGNLTSNKSDSINNNSNSIRSYASQNKTLTAGQTVNLQCNRATSDTTSNKGTTSAAVVAEVGKELSEVPTHSVARSSKDIPVVPQVFEMPSSHHSGQKAAGIRLRIKFNGVPNVVRFPDSDSKSAGKRLLCHLLDKRDDQGSRKTKARAV
eukprot:TRINITY_DN6794_c0_g1_i2.p1 TRINITY_DN6794_c0_g1~~TRINITY_DN6794_c0_g1_i2.p1  ORF type:complete len:341 (+),score=32.91 TRINITY_DN6794_c0_g1_i2:69-1091(+)